MGSSQSQGSSYLLSTHHSSKNNHIPFIENDVDKTTDRNIVAQHHIPFIENDVDKTTDRNIVAQQEAEIVNKLEQARIKEEKKQKEQEEFDKAVTNELVIIRSIFEQNGNIDKYEKCKTDIEKRLSCKKTLERIQRINRQLNVYNCYSEKGKLLDSCIKSTINISITDYIFQLYTLVGYNVDTQCSHSVSNAYQRLTVSETFYLLTISPKDNSST